MKELETTVTHYAAIVLEWLDADAEENKLQRRDLVDMFIDTLQALEQWKSQED